MCLCTAKGPPTSAALQALIIHESSGIERIDISAKNSLIDMQLLIWH